jgi:NADPH2:quinone reductase
MKALVAHAYGPPESFVLEDLPPRAPGPDEVRVRVRSAGISFVDLLIAAGKHQSRPPPPFTPGSEFSGEVIAVGAQVAHVAPGDLVCGGTHIGVFAEEITLAADRVQKLPSHVDLDEAAVLRPSYLTAWFALAERGRLAAGETVLVLGAAGAVGIATCQLARFLGARVIASASTEAKRAFALRNGAAHAIDSGAADWREQVKALTSGRGVDLVVDPVGGAATERAFRALAYKGRHLVVGFAEGSIPSLPANLPLLKGASLVGVLAALFVQEEPQAAAAARARILDLFAAGELKPPVGQVFPLADYVEAMTAVARGDVLGRVLLRMG